MSGQNTEYLTETDPDDGGEGPLLPAPVSLPDGIAPARNAPAAPQLRDARGTPPEQPFEIIETDDNFNPLPRNQQPAEPRLSEIDAGPRSLVERQAAEDAAADAAGRPRQPRTAAERRAARREGRDRTLQENQRLSREVEELRAWREQWEPQLAQIGPRLSEIDQSRVADQLAAFDRGIAEAQARGADARRRISEAMIAQDGDALNAALELRDNAVMETQRLTVQRNMLATGDPLGRTDQPPRQPDPRAQPRQQPQPQAPRPLSARAQALADDFASRHDWITTVRAPDGSTRGRDIDSDIALRLDFQVASEGFDPSGLEYWDRLDELMTQYLPHRAGEVQPSAPPPRRAANGDGNGQRRQAPPPERRGPMVPGGGDRPPAGPSGNQVYLSPARKLALQEAGIIGRDGTTVEDQTRFRRVLKQYQEFDRANGTVRQ
jgi:hypothetical protein